MSGICWNEISPTSNGGTEIMCRELERRVPKDLMDQFQIIPSRLRTELDPTKIRIYYAHDTENDPEAQKALANNNWTKFHRLVFVSNHQMQRFIQQHNLPWDRCVVMRNAIDPIPYLPKPDGKVRLVYTSTPQRGLDVLGAAFSHLAQTDPDIELEVFSSYELYGWKDADRQFEPLFVKLDEHPQITRHKAVPNEQIREALQKAHIFAYPSTWIETSCLCLMEAMSAGLVCVHPNYGALYETAANLTMMYQWHADKSQHAGIFATVLQQAVKAWRDKDDNKLEERMKAQSFNASVFVSWERRQMEWQAFLESLVQLPREFEKPMFHYKVG